MVVAPLMTAVMGVGMSIVRGDTLLLRRAASTLLRGMVAVIALGALLTAVVPNSAETTEVLVRTRPSLLDLGVALASGAAGAYAMCRKDVSAALAGVAIAAALVPPLASVGITLAHGHLDFAGGALLLFLTNLVAISAMSAFILLLFGFAPPAERKAERVVLSRGVLGQFMLLGLIAVVLGLLTVQSVQAIAFNETVRQAIREGVAELPAMEFVEMERIEATGDVLQIDVTVRSGETLPPAMLSVLQRDLARRLDRPVELTVTMVPMLHLNPITPAPTAPLR